MLVQPPRLEQVAMSPPTGSFLLSPARSAERDLLDVVLLAEDAFIRQATLRGEVRAVLVR
jgi:hypothetical protein